ncbi:hypothetical protein C7S16_5823 [Burkholderia thailandensis]|uniref:Uncharacterized protein n=1 Tax=Burkholderia thailandensis TaxID=57975 RepID=A0AAW9CN63_BURTH|nr:hypothetical protein [Burkholderia thailandensis]MDW9251011.1 hypothetical protein [Burkholderia thailandensis]
MRCRRERRSRAARRRNFGETHRLAPIRALPGRIPRHHA